MVRSSSSNAKVIKPGVWESIHQLQSGSEQVQSVAFANGRLSTPLVIATCLKNACEVFLIDPPGDQPSNGKDSISREKAVQDSPRRWTVTDPERFSKDLARFHSAQLLT